MADDDDIIRVIAHPFRLTPAGRAATVAQDSDRHHAELIAALAQTELGERPLAPGFGVTDPDDPDPVQVIAGVATFGPPVAITGYTRDPIDEHSARLVITFE